MKTKPPTNRAKVIPIRPKEMPAIRPCWSCNVETTIEKWSDIDPSPLFPPPLWIVENEWLLQYGALCPDCIEAGKRIELCFEGYGSPHNFWDFGDDDPRSATCLDCGWNDDLRRKPTAIEMNDLTRTLFEETIAAREAAIVVLVRRLELLSGPPRNATALRLARLREDLAWRVMRLNEMGHEKTGYVQ
jgi:hypothetical protein